MASKLTKEQYVALAKKLQVAGEIEVDDNAEVSMNDAQGESNGAYVQAWIWVDDPSGE